MVVVVVVRMVAVAVAVSLLAGPVAAGQAVACLRPPVDAAVVDAFREPPCEWCPGNRGLAYATRSGEPVRAAAAGTVSFSDVVAGTRYVVVDHAEGGLRATYGGLASTPLSVGDVVTAGAVVGVAGEELHFGLRRGDSYVDPAPLLGRLVQRARLVPTDGTPARAAPTSRLDCSGTGTSAAVLPMAGVDLAGWLGPHHDYPAVDVMVPTGTPVVAWRAGRVRNVHTDLRRSCGIGVTVADAASPGVTWTYCHLSRLEVRTGDVLTAGQRVGRSGNTGRSGAPHLHLEVRVSGRQVCPQPALRSIAATGTMADPRHLPTTGCSF